MLKEKLQGDMKDALKSGNSQKRTLLGMVLSSIKNKEIEKKGELSDDDVVMVISSEIKKRKDSIEQFEKGGRPELAEEEKKEAEMLMAYMPEQMTEDAIRAEVQKVIAEIRSTSSGQAGIKDMKETGKVIGAVMAKVKGKADGTLVGKIVKEELSK